MVSGVTFHRREPLRISLRGLVHPADTVEPTAAHVLFISQRFIQQRIADLAHHIAHDYHGKPLQLLVVLKGAKPFADALCQELRKLALPQLFVETAEVSSYRGTASTGTVTLQRDIPKLHSHSVLIVEDIVDTGATAKFLLDYLHRRGIQEIGVCTLLHKKDRTKHLLPLQYVGFEVPDVWVVGFGLDYNEQYRELPYVAKLVF